MTDEPENVVKELAMLLDEHKELILNSEISGRFSAIIDEIYEKKEIFEKQRRRNLDLESISNHASQISCISSDLLGEYAENKNLWNIQDRGVLETICDLSESISETWRILSPSDEILAMMKKRTEKEEKMLEAFGDLAG